jgi:hypothetical protein
MGCVGCVVTPEQLLRKAKSSDDSMYGYDAAHAIPMKNGDVFRSIAGSSYFINHLQTGNGKRFRVVSRRTVDDPTYEPAWINPTIRPAGSPFSQPLFPKGLVDAYILVSEDAADTVTLYINCYRSGPLMVPKPLQLIVDEKL